MEKIKIQRIEEDEEVIAENGQYSDFIDASVSHDNHVKFVNEGVIIKDKKIKLELNYPLSQSFFFEFENENGFTIHDLIKLTRITYRQIYAEENETSQLKVLPMGERIIKQRGLLNRNKTNGKYGIYGHDINDLIIVTMYYNPNTCTVKPGIDS